MNVCEKCDSSMSLWCDAEVKQLKENRSIFQTKIEILKAKIKELRRKAKIIKVGNLMPPDFATLIRTTNIMNLNDPESAYLYGWESAILECEGVLC